MDIAYIVKCVHVISTFFKLVAHFCKHVFVVSIVFVCMIAGFGLLLEFP